MEPAFWQDRWQKQEIGFHEGQVNRHLLKHWPQMQAQPSSTVLAPLCGKAVDLAWLGSQGLRVVGVELSQIACEAFFAEQGVEPEIDRGQNFTRYRNRNIELFCGDFFDLSAELIGPVNHVYDRAALIALPPDMRPKYVSHLKSLVSEGARTLLITLDYREQSGFQGPPFCVNDQEVKSLYGSGFSTERVYHAPLPEGDGLQKRGLRDGTESVFLIHDQR